MKTEEEIKKRLEWTEFLIDEYHRELQEFRYWNLFIHSYWLLKWVLEDSEFTTKSEEGKE